MYKNRAHDGSNNICSESIRRYRKKLGFSQKQLSDQMQIIGIDIDKNAIQRIEAGKRFVTDIEIKAFVKVLHITYEDLLG